MASVKKRAQNGGPGRWYLYWREPDGKQRSRSLGSATEAEARIALAAKQLELGEEARNRSRAPYFSDWTREYLNWHANEYPDSHYRTRQIAQQWLAPVFGSQRMDEIKKAHVEQYKAARRAAVGTVAKELRVLQAIFNKAVDWDVIPKNPIKGVRPPLDEEDSAPRYLTAAELQSLYAASSYRASWWRLLVHTGMRRSEALNLRWDHIEGNILQVVSIPGARTKSRKSRGVPLTNAAQDALAGMLDAVGHSKQYRAEFVFPRMHPRSLSRHFEEDAARAGIQATLHDTRHTFCSQLVLRGVHLRKVQQLAGHSTIRTTERYAKLLVTDLADDVRLLEGL